MGLTRSKTIKIFLTLLILFTVINTGVMIFKEIRKIRHGEFDANARYFSSFEHVPNSIPLDATISYIKDNGISDAVATESIHVLQYILAPRLIISDKDSRYIFLMIEDSKKLEIMVKKEKLAPVMTVGHGFMLCKRTGP